MKYLQKNHNVGWVEHSDKTGASTYFIIPGVGSMLDYGVSLGTGKPNSP